MTVDNEQQNRPLSDNIVHLESEEATLENTPRKDVSDSDDKFNDRRKARKDGILPDKEFLPRNSLLTELYSGVLHNICVVTILLTLMSTAILEFTETGTIHLGTKTIIKGFGKLPIVIYIWSAMTATSFLLYSVFAFWAKKRLNFQTKCKCHTDATHLLKILDYGVLISLILYQIAFLIFPAMFILEEELPYASSMIVAMEQVRMLMKTHAFVRSNVPRVLKFKSQTEEEEDILCPRFSQFLYFMFAPTLVYRDNYPRTKVIRWKFVAQHFMEIILLIFYFACLYERVQKSELKQFGCQPVNSKIFFYTLFIDMVFGISAMFCSFYCILHCWMNGCAELLQFADRMFYGDWWNSTTFRTHFRRINIIAYDWLYSYIYKDMYEIVTPKSKIISLSTVFFVSAVFHEYVIVVCLQFFYPAMLIAFVGIGIPLVTITNKFRKLNGNIIHLFYFCFGWSFLFNLYMMETFARINCAPHDNKILDFFIPRSWFCRKLITSN